jgi:hypothetical protein
VKRIGIEDLCEAFAKAICENEGRMAAKEGSSVVMEEEK